MNFLALSKGTGNFFIHLKTTTIQPAIICRERSYLTS